MNWKKGDNGSQEYFTAGIGLDVCRNHREQHWVIYDLRNNEIAMIPNPNPSTQQLRFKAVNPQTKAIRDSPNYAWDDPQKAMRHAETILRA